MKVRKQMLRGPCAWLVSVSVSCGSTTPSSFVGATDDGGSVNASSGSGGSSTSGSGGGGSLGIGSASSGSGGSGSGPSAATDASASGSSISSGSSSSSSSSGGFGSSSTSGGATASSNSSSSGGGLGTGAGVSTTCVAGSLGCLCDSTGKCAPTPAGLACTPQSAGDPSLCCSGSNCAGPTTGIGAVCGVGNASGALCTTPGITIPTASNGNDNCGYPASGFKESTILCGISATGGGSTPAIIQVFYNDEHALPLGCATTTYPVSGLPSNPGSVNYPKTGDPACVDTSGRPLRPVLYVTDITNDANCTSGDQQNGGQAYDPVAIFGTWKTANEGTGNVGTPVSGDPSPKNYWNLGPSADPVAASAVAACPCTTTSCSASAANMGKGYGAELRFEVGLVAFHSYRLQVMLHDGDQTQGGDSGEGCAVFCAGQI